MAKTWIDRDDELSGAFVMNDPFIKNDTQVSLCDRRSAARLGRGLSREDASQGLRIREQGFYLTR